MDIKKRKPKPINLRKRKVIVHSPPVSVEVKEVVSEPAVVTETGIFPCIKCGVKEAPVEMGRCKACEAEHQKLAKSLDARPRQTVERAKENYDVFKAVRNGVIVTYK